MASVTATINVQINAANAAAQLTALQGKVAAMNKGMLAATAGGVMAQEKAIRRMGNVLSGSGMFTTGIRNVHTELGRMHQEFDRGSTTLQKYRQNSRMWGRDHSAINRMAADRVRMLQSQYVALGKEMNGVQKSMQIKPDRMMREFGADAMYAHQRAMLFRRNLQMGSTALVNWGKNTQWAGRQMMVGMGIPIAIAAAGAVKAFNDIEKASISFKRVYGDATTSVAEKSQMLSKMQATVGKEMMKYGVAMSDTLEVSAQAAATGAKGADLIAATRETMRLATLGNMDYNKALGATIAMQTAFNINAKDMASTTDFLNAVENQTILTMEDMASAVPRVAPVIKGLGGNVQDLAIMMTALRQGGVTAEQGANALKSGLGSLLNPTGTAIDQFDALGINLQKVVDTNKGDLIGTIKSLGKELDGLGKYDRQRALESLFGKYQYSRMGALLKNINSKAAKETMRLAKANTSELAKMSQQELDQISSSPMIKLRASIEELKAAAAPLGALFSDVAAKIVSFATPIVSFFANNDIAKWGLVATAGFAALAGVVTMIVGVFANFTGSMIKAGMAVKSFFRLITGQRSLAYVTTDELEASAAANSLATAAERAAGGMMAEAKAAQLLTSQLEALIAAQNGAAATSRRPGPGTTGTPVAPKPSGPGGTPIPPAGVVAPLSQSQSSQFASGWDRAHAARPMILRPGDAAYDSTREYYKKRYTKDGQLVIPNTDNGRILNDMIANKSVLAYNAEAFLMQEQFNRDMDSGRGANASEVAKQARSLGPRSASPYFFNLARAAGNRNAASQAAFLNTPEIRNAMSTMSTGYTQALVDHAARNPILTGQDFERITAPVLEQTRAQLRAISPEMSAAVDRLMLPGFMSSESQSSRTAIAEAAAGGISWGKAGNIPEMLDVMPVTPGAAPTPEERSRQEAQSQRTERRRREAQARIERNSSADIERRRAAVAKSRAARLGGQKTGIRLMEERAAAGLNEPLPPVLNGDDRGRRGVARPPRQFTGMGLMGVGMLAQTAVMGMQMAGKEVPRAAEFASMGLMTMGMAAMSFPKTTQKVGDALSKVIGVMPPVVKAVAALGIVVASSALIWKTLNQKWRRDGINLGKAVTDATQGLDETGQIFGKTGYVDKQIAKDQKTSDKSMTTGEEFLKSDVGKRWLDDYANTASKAGVATATGSFASNLATAVVNGVMGTSDVKGVFAALTKENAVMASSIKADFLKLVGGSMKNIDPFAASLAVNRQNKIQSDALLSASQQRIEQAKQASSTQWSASGYGTTTGAVVGRTMQQRINIRALMQENAGIAAGAWSGTIATAFQNRLAAEAQLSQMIEARDDLASKKNRTADETKQMNRLTSQINNGTKAIGKMDSQVHKTMDGIEALYNAEGTDRGAMERSIFESLGQNDNKMVRLAGAMLDGAAIGDQRVKFTMAVALESGMLQPEALMNMFNQFGSPDAAATTLELGINTIGTAPAMDFFNALATVSSGKQTAALRTFGNEFTTIANKAKLSAKEAGALAKALGASPKQVKDVKVNVKKGKVEDPGKDIKKNRTVNVKGDTKGAKKDIQDLGKETDKVGKKKASVKARVDGATKGINDLKSLGKAADGANKKKVKIDADTSNAEAKAKQVEAALSQGNPPPIPITAQDRTTAVTVAVQAQIVAMQALAAQPLSITAVNNASSTLQAIISQLAQIQSKTVTVTVNKVENDAIGGLVGGYATGGVHTGDGKVTGPGGPTDDKVNARLSDGEFVIRASSVDKYGTAFLSAVNRGVYDKNGFAKGSPIGAKKMDKDQRKDYASLIRDANATTKKINALDRIIEALVKNKSIKKLFGGDQSLIYQFARKIVDENDPKQIKKMFAKKKDKGAVRLALQARKEREAEIRDEFQSQRKEARLQKGLSNAIIRRNVTDPNSINPFAEMSTDQFDLFKGMTAKGKEKYKKNMVLRKKAEDAAAASESLAGYGKGSEARMFSKVSDTGIPSDMLSKYADALGMSLEDLANQVDNNMLPKNFTQLGDAALSAKKAMDALAMTKSERDQARVQNIQSIMSAKQDSIDAKVRSEIKGNNKTGNKSQIQLEADMAVTEANNAILQAQVDDINYKYEKQLETFDQIAQVQQAIANLERGRLSVANALSTGDIAAAAMAAQEQRANTAAFMQEQMRNQLTNQQKAQTAALEEQIRIKANENRDIQNQIALITAQINQNSAGTLSELQDQADAIAGTPEYYDAIANSLRDQNAVLAMNTAQLQEQVRLAQAIAPIINNNPVPVVAGSASGTKKVVKKKKVKKKKAFGGWVPGVGNSDNVPLLATPGEFVMRKAAAARFGPTLQAMNAGTLKSVGGSGGVQIDNIIFNINGANLNERDIAEIAVRKMKSLDSATIRGGRF